MIPDAELLSLLCTILTRLEIGEFTVKVCRFFFFRTISVFTFPALKGQSQENTRWYLRSLRRTTRENPPHIVCC